MRYAIHPSDPDFVPDVERHTRFTETQAGALVHHDYAKQQYMRNYQSEVDLDIIRRYVDRNFCSRYPDVTVRYMAQNWPELCIFVLLKPFSEQTKKKLVRYVGSAPLRYINEGGEFQFYI